jgi:hypothetical protein
MLNIPLRTLVFWRPLILFVVYRGAKAQPDAQVSLFGLVNIKNIHFPFVMLRTFAPSSFFGINKLLNLSP